MNVFLFLLKIAAIYLIAFPSFGQPVSPDSSLETKSLLIWLHTSNGRVAIGSQHIANESGWDIQRRISGFSPLVYGIEYRDSAGIDRDPTYWEWSRNLVIDIYNKGGIVTIVDHMPNFVTRGSTKSRHPDLPGELLPGGIYHEDYKGYLDRFALFARNVSVNGVRVPMIYRPFHEMNGGWFWWGKSSKFVELWKFTFTYLTEVKGLNNLLWAWSPNIEVWDIDKMSKYWPGKEYVDIVGLDGYGNSNIGSFGETAFRMSYTVATTIADISGKPFVWAEIGFEKTACNRPDFWTNDFQKSLDDFYPKAKFALIWNGNFGPRPGCPSAPAFKVMMSNTARFISLGGVDPVSIYGNGYEAVVQ